MNKDDLKRRTDEALATLRRARDEIRVELHLASMDLKDCWKELEPRLAEAEKIAEELGGEITEASRKAVEEVAARARELRNAIKGQRNGHRPAP